jgi:hypothetical protein
MKWYYIILIIILVGAVIYYYLYPLYLQYTLRKISVDLFTSLNNNNVEYWADFGTLLGIVRENDIIWWDTDVDVVVVDTPELHEKMKLVGDDLSKKGYTMEKMNWRAYRVYHLGLYADLYINSVNLDKNVYIGATGKNGDSDIPLDYIGNCSWLTWKKYNIPVRVPEKIHETLSWRYGEDYMTPKRWFKGRDS